MSLTSLIKISRPRFWIYTLGPFLVGYIAGVSDVLFWKHWDFAIFFFYFLIPANILVYGVNDLSDEDTDQYNKRKGEEGYEVELKRRDRKVLTFWVAISGALGVLISLSSIQLLSAMSLFLFFSVFYSLKPLRFKARPFLDAYSNFLYLGPALVGYIVTTGHYPTLLWILIGVLWVAGMHTFSAIPDIEADKKAGITTTAVKLGRKGALIFVGSNWLLFSLLIISQVGVAMLPALIYPLITLFLYNKDTEYISNFYRYFPIINGILGFLAFWYILLSKFSIETVIDNIPF